MCRPNNDGLSKETCDIDGSGNPKTIEGSGGIAAEGAGLGIEGCHVASKYSI
jgi:hypothetical protein